MAGPDSRSRSAGSDAKGGAGHRCRGGRWEAQRRARRSSRSWSRSRSWGSRWWRSSARSGPRCGSRTRTRRPRMRRHRGARVRRGDEAGLRGGPEPLRPVHVPATTSTYTVHPDRSVRALHRERHEGPVPGRLHRRHAQLVEHLPRDRRRPAGDHVEHHGPNNDPDLATTETVTIVKRDATQDLPRCEVIECTEDSP